MASFFKGSLQSSLFHIWKWLQLFLNLYNEAIVDENESERLVLFSTKKSNKNVGFWYR